jgi:hypothetical protein
VVPIDSDHFALFDVGGVSLTHSNRIASHINGVLCFTMLERKTCFLSYQGALLPQGTHSLFV